MLLLEALNNPLLSLNDLLHHFWAQSLEHQVRRKILLPKAIVRRASHTDSKRDITEAVIHDVAQSKCLSSAPFPKQDDGWMHRKVFRLHDKLSDGPHNSVNRLHDSKWTFKQFRLLLWSGALLLFLFFLILLGEVAQITASSQKPLLDLSGSGFVRYWFHIFKFTGR